MQAYRKDTEQRALPNTPWRMNRRKASCAGAGPPQTEREAGDEGAVIRGSEAPWLSARLPPVSGAVTPTRPVQ
jgi:hypothetical protein